MAEEIARPESEGPAEEKEEGLTDEQIAKKEREIEALLDMHDPGELSLIDGFYEYEVTLIDGSKKKLRVKRMTLRSRMKFQRFLAGKTPETRITIKNLPSMSEAEQLKLLTNFNFDLLSEVLSLVFGEAMDNPTSEVCDCTSQSMLDLCGLIIHREKLVDFGAEKRSKEKVDDVKDPI